MLYFPSLLLKCTYYSSIPHQILSFKIYCPEFYVSDLTQATIKSNNTYILYDLCCNIQYHHEYFKIPTCVYTAVHSVYTLCTLYVHPVYTVDCTYTVHCTLCTNYLSVYTRPRFLQPISLHDPDRSKFDTLHRSPPVFWLVDNSLVISYCSLIGYTWCCTALWLVDGLITPAHAYDCL